MVAAAITHGPAEGDRSLKKVGIAAVSFGRQFATFGNFDHAEKQLSIVRAKE